jgi:hypothetical protein
MPPRKGKQGRGTGTSQPSRESKQPAASIDPAATAAAAADAGTAAAEAVDFSRLKNEPEYFISRLLKRLSTTPDMRMYTTLAATILTEVRTLQADTPGSSSSSSSGVLTAPVSDLAGALAKGLHLLENWAVEEEQGPAVLEAMALMADSLAAAWGKAHSADNAGKMKMVRMLVEAGEAEVTIVLVTFLRQRYLMAIAAKLISSVWHVSGAAAGDN